MKWPIFCGMAWPRGFWFRVCGVGLHVKLAKGHQMLFSERNGYCRAVYVFGLRLELLPRRGM